MKTNYQQRGNRADQINRLMGKPEIYTEKRPKRFGHRHTPKYTPPQINHSPKPKTTVWARFIEILLKIWASIAHRGEGGGSIAD